MENQAEIEPLVKRLGKAYTRAHSSSIAFEENTKAIFESIGKSIINGELYLPPTGLDSDLKKEDIENDGNKFIAITKSYGASMFTIHFRSPVIKSDGGRIYNACSENENNEIKEFHDVLLKLYFNLFGRINTFNERMFEYFVSSTDKTPKLFRVKFNTESESNLLEIIGNSHSINICPELANSLAPDSLINQILNPTISIDKFGWYQFIKAQGLKTQLDNSVDNQWHKILSDEASITKWQSLLLFLDSAATTKISLEWNPITKAHLKKALKFIQGISIYRHFAPAEIVSILSAINDNRDIFGVTIGFKDNTINTDEFITALSNQIQEFGSNVIPTIKTNVLEDTSHSFKPENAFGDEIWKEIKKDINGNSADLVLFSKCAEAIEKIKGLAFASHEGDDIKFTLYFGRQPSLSRFNEICDFTTQDLESLKSNFPNFLKSHYSLFQSNLNGLFIDVIYESQISLVKPLSILPSISDTKQNDFLELDSLLGNQSDENTLKSLTDSDHHLLALEVGMNQMKIFYKGAIYLKWPGGDNYLWSKNKFGEWSDEAKLSTLIKKIISFSSIENESEKNYVTNSIVKTVLKVSGEKGKGGMLVFGKTAHEYLLEGCKSKLNVQQIAFWKTRKINECDADDLFNMLIPDGATLINIDSLIIENQIQIIPIENGKAIDLSSLISNGISKGTKHMTGKAISKAKSKEILIVCISADGPVTVYYDGSEIGITDLSKIQL